MLPDIVLRTLTAAGYAAVASGVALMHRPAGLIVAGLLLSLWAWQVAGGEGS